MEEKKKVWIKGRKDRGDEIKGILTGLGAEAKGLNCNEGDCVYFIDHENGIGVTFTDSELAQIIMDNYREIELPRQEWKDGDVLVCDNWPGHYAVFKKYREDGLFETYLTVDEGGVSLNAMESVEFYHLASGKELEVAAKMLYTVSRKLFKVRKKLKK